MNIKIKKYMMAKLNLEKLAGKKVVETVTEEKVVLQPEVKKEEAPALAELLPSLAEVAIPVVESVVEPVVAEELVVETPVVPVAEPVFSKKNKKVVEN